MNDSSLTGHLLPEAAHEVWKEQEKKNLSRVIESGGQTLVFPGSPAFHNELSKALGCWGPAPAEDRA